MQYRAYLGIFLATFFFPKQGEGQEKTISAEEYLRQNFRFVSEISPLQQKWISLEDDVFVNITSVDQKVDWGKMNERAIKLVEEEIEFTRHHAEDLQQIAKQLNEKEAEKLKPFIDQSFVYGDVLSRAINRLTHIVNQLYKKSLDPESYSAKAYLEDTEKYQALREEYDAEGKKMNEEFERLKDIQININ